MSNPTETAEGLPERSPTLDDESSLSTTGLFVSMIKWPAVYMWFLPVVLVLCMVFGWTQDNIIESGVSNIWIKRSGRLHDNTMYASSINMTGLLASSMAAMSIARDGGNLLTEERLSFIRGRMQELELMDLDFNGVTYYWPDFCASTGGFPYEFPCVRLSPMDFWKEANWYFDYPYSDKFPDKEELYRRTWYRELVQPVLVAPRIPRFGVLSTDCAFSCIELLSYRICPSSPGYSPLSLFGDMGGLEMNDPCRICIEDTYEQQVKDLHQAVLGSMQVLTAELQRALESESLSSNAASIALDIIPKTAKLSQSISTNDVRDFYKYYVGRNVYARLGAGAYLEGYQLLSANLDRCTQGVILGFVCPPANITSADAEQALLNHADADFSSVTTAGSPLPLWSESDGTGALFGGSKPVGGSGIDMSGELLGILAYLDAPNYLNRTAWNPVYGPDGFLDPLSSEWETMVETNPLFAWFMAGETPAKPGTQCGNGYLTGTDTPLDFINNETSAIARSISSFWCTKYDVPNEHEPSEGSYSKQYFAKMWYDLLISSDSFLSVTEGKDDPFLWTTGQGCGYSLGSERDSYAGANESEILNQASRYLYTIDEGVSIGAVVPALLIGGIEGDFNSADPLRKVSVMQTLYAILRPEEVVERVRSCKRPQGAVELTFEEAEQLTAKWKEKMDETWTRGWDDETQEVQMVALTDDSGSSGTFARLLREITLDNNSLTAASILLIAAFSVAFLISADPVESRVIVTLIGVTLVVVSFFGAVGFAILTGIKISINIAWTLPFVILGLGVDDMYIVLESIKQSGGYSDGHFLAAMKEVVIPVTMTSLVNASMFAILNLSDIPAIYLTARVAVYCVIALYLAIIFCFPAYCYIDMRRQAAGRCDWFVCIQSREPSTVPTTTIDFREEILFTNLYEPLVLGRRGSRDLRARVLARMFIWFATVGLVFTGGYGITERQIGLGLEDFFPATHQTSVWATRRTEELASWGVAMRWGPMNYSDPDVQMRLIKQFEDVVSTPKIVDTDTRFLWLADLLVWSSRHCSRNFDREDFDKRECGADVVFEDTDGSIKSCTASWTQNGYGLRTKMFSDYDNEGCSPLQGGICRPLDRMHPLDIEEARIDVIEQVNSTFCPMITWTDYQWKYCMQQWRNITGAGGSGFVLGDERGTPKSCEGEFHNDEEVIYPLPHSASPTMFAVDLFSHQDTLDMLRETRAICDDDESMHCWMIGIPFDYWSQYDGIFEVLVELSSYSLAVGFGIAWVFLFGTLYHDNYHSFGRILLGSLVGALLIALTLIMSLTTVVGLSVLAGVALTGFSNMSFVLSVGFAVEYSVHVVMRWLRADLCFSSALERVRHTMSFLMLPTFMSFVSSTIGVACLAFTEFEFNQVFFFRPLIIVMFTTYFFGCWWLPLVLTMLDFDVVKLGKPAPHTTSPSSKEDKD